MACPNPWIATRIAVTRIAQSEALRLDFGL